LRLCALLNIRMVQAFQKSTFLQTIGSDATQAAIVRLVAYCDSDVGCARHWIGASIPPTRGAGASLMQVA
jgi:hypothetical protein